MAVITTATAQAFYIAARQWAGMSVSGSFGFVFYLALTSDTMAWSEIDAVLESGLRLCFLAVPLTFSLVFPYVLVVRTVLARTAADPPRQRQKALAFTAALSVAAVALLLSNLISSPADSLLTATVCLPWMLAAAGMGWLVRP
jgi:hypothetical protein